MSDHPAAETRRSLWIPWALGGIFLAFLIANSAMLYFAGSSWTGLSTEGAYDRGLAYNDALAAEEAQAALGWQAAVKTGLVSGRDAWVELDLADRNGHGVVADAVWARFVRPTHAGADREVLLSPIASGRYRGEVELPLLGQWDLRLRVEHSGGIYRSSRRIFLESDG